MNKVSILITTHDRDHLLKWGLDSLTRVESSIPLEVIVLNEGSDDKKTQRVVKEYSDKLDIKYFHTWVTKIDKEGWRCPSFALNIGAKQSTGDILIISCAEMYLVDTDLDLLLEPLKSGERLLSTTTGKDDDQRQLNSLNTKGEPDISSFNSMTDLNTLLPFFMACRKDQYVDIGGYDEEFVGAGWDDDDFVLRMRKTGADKIVRTGFRVIHLWHDRKYNSAESFDEACKFNSSMFTKKAAEKQWIRNTDKPWGVWSAGENT